MILGFLIVLMALLGAPIFSIIAVNAMLGYSSSGIDLMAIVIEIIGITDMPMLSAIPLFTFSGYLLSESGAPKRLVYLTRAIIGWMPGGLSFVAISACAFFTAFTGASGVTIIALGAILYPALKQDGYSDRFNLGLITTTGSLGLLFAPSLPLILYAIVAEIPVQDLFKAGIFPGLLMLTLLATYSLWVNRSNRKSFEEFSWNEVFIAIGNAKWEIPLPIFVLGGIYSGIFAVSEAAALTAVYVLMVEVFILKEIKLKKIPKIMSDSMLLVGGILIILGVSLASTNYMIDADIPQILLSYISLFVSDQATFLILLFIFLLILGAILDIFSAVVLVVPLIMPIAAQYDVNQIHLGIIFLASMQLGYLTPPVGLNLFIASYRFNRSIMDVYLATLPFFLILALCVVIIMYWPSLSLYLLA